MKRNPEKELQTHGYDAFLKEQLKDPKFAKDFRKAAGKTHLGYQVFLARERLGITQQELARRIGTRQSNISRLEQGNYNFTVSMLEKIAQALGASLKVELTPSPEQKAA